MNDFFFYSLKVFHLLSNFSRQGGLSVLSLTLK